MVKIGKFINIIKCLKKIYSHSEENKIYKLIVCILDNVFYNKCHLTSSLVPNFSEIWWPLELLLTLWSITRQRNETVVKGLWLLALVTCDR